MIGANNSIAIPLFADSSVGGLSDAFFGTPQYAPLMSYRYDIVLEKPGQGLSTLGSELIV